MKSRALLAALSFACTLPLLGCNSSDEPIDETPPGTSVPPPPTEPSPNIAATRAALEQANLDWATTNYQNYLFSNTTFAFDCNGDSSDLTPPSTQVVLDTGDVFRMDWYARPDEDGLLTFRGDAITYTTFLEDLAAILDQEPAVLERFGSSDEPPEFDQRGVLDNWKYQLRGANCADGIATERMQPLSDYEYDVIGTFERMDEGYRTWQLAGLEDYTMELRFITGSCAEPHSSGLATIRVIEGVPDDIEWEGEELPDYLDGTVDHILFERLAGALGYPPAVMQASTDNPQSVQFDSNFGFPRSYYMEHHNENNCRAEGVIVESFN